MKYTCYLTLFLLAGLASISPIANAQTDSDNSATRRYIFPHKGGAKRIEPYQTTVYSTDAVSVKTMKGDLLHKGKDSVINFAVNPAGVNYGVVTRNKKGERAANFYHTEGAEQHLYRFNAKKFGQPVAVGYTPDARGVIVATEKEIYFLDPRTYLPIVKIVNVPVVTEKMALSPNGYYLAVAGQGRVIVYNLQENKIRKDLAIGEEVNEVMFSPDNKDFGVLTADGLLSLYNTRTFDLRKMVDNLGEARAAAFNLDGKYVSVVTGDNTIAVVNLLRDSDREYYTAQTGSVADVDFISDAARNTILTYPTALGMEAMRLMHLKPFYNKLIDEEADARMADWLKMMPGETMEEYQARVNEATRQRQRRLFEEEAATRFAGDLLAGASMSIGSYDRANGVLALNFDSMPTIYLPVPEGNVTAIRSADDLRLSDVMYGVMPDDSFEIVYAKVTNLADGNTYVYDNVMRSDMQYMAADDAISLEVLQQQQMEELKLQELREKVMQEAKKMNVISDHTQITVDSKVVPEYDAAGNKILNFAVGFTYTVDPEFSMKEDFGPGKYHVEESGAAMSMLDIVRKAFEGDLKQYIVPGKRMKVRVSAGADATPIVHGIAYDGAYGDYTDEPVYINGNLAGLTVTRQGGIKENEQLAFVRAMGVKDYLTKNINGLEDMTTDYKYEVNVSQDKGSEHRRISLDLVFEDAY